MSRRSQKFLGVLILLGTLGVASCQSFLADAPPQALPGISGGGQE